MKIKITIILIILILVTVVYAADRKWSVFPVNTTVDDADEMLLIDIGTGNSERITVINLFDTIDTSLELLTILTDETGTGALVFAIAPTFVTPILGVIASGVGTTLTALNGENIQDDTIDDDSIDFADVTFADFDFETAWRMWHSDAAGDVTEITLGVNGTFLESNGAAANPAFRALVDGDVPDNITIDLATLATTVTVTDDDATNDNQEIVFTTDNANLESDTDFHYNPSTGTITVTEFVGGGAGLTAIDGENITDDTIDNDSIDWGDMTDLTTDGALDADVVDEAHIADNGIDSEHYNDGSIDYAHLADDVISGAAAVGTFESGDTFLVLEAGVGLREADFDDLPVTATAWDDIGDSDAATTTSMASNDHTFSNVDDYTWTSGTTSKPDLVIINTNDDATAGSFTLRKAGSTPTPADDDYLGTINYEGDDSGGNNTVYVRLIGQSSEINDGDEAGEYHIMVMFDDGTPALDEMFSIYGDITGPGTGKFIWNHDSQDMDYQMETDDEDHFLYIDGGANWLRVGDWDTNYVQTTSAGVMTFAGTGDIDLPDDSVDDDDINWADLTYLTTNGAGIDEAFGAGWNGDVGPAEKDDIYDILHAYDTDDDGEIDTLDTDSVADNEIDYANVTFADFDYETNWRMWHSNGAGDVTEITLGANGTFLESNGASAAPAFRTLVDGDVPDTITVDLSTLASTVTTADDDATNDNQEIVFTTTPVGAAALETDTDFHYNPSTGTVTAIEFVGGGAGITSALTDNSIADTLHRHTELVSPNGSIDPVLSTDNNGRVGIGTVNPSEPLELRVVAPLIRLRATGSTANNTAAYVEFGGTTSTNWNRTGYVGDNRSGDTHIRLRAEDSNLVLGDSTSADVLTLSGGDVTVTGALEAATLTEGGNAVISETVATGAIIFGDSTPDADGEIAFDTTGDGSTVTAGVLDIHDGTEVVHYFGSAGYPTGDNQILKYDAGTNKVIWEADAGAAGGDEWGDAVDSDILPTGADNTYDLGSVAASFKDGYFQGTLEAGTLTEGGNAVPNATDHLGFFGGTTSAELAGEISDETGSGKVTFATAPVFVTSIQLTGADANPAAAAGTIVYDSTIAGMSGGGLRWYDNDSVRMIVDLETDPSNDDYVVAYDSTADGFYMKVDDDTGGATKWNAIADADGVGSIDFVTYTQTIDIGKSDSGGGSGLVLDVTGLGAGTDDVIALKITTTADLDADYIPIEVRHDSGGSNDLLFSVSAYGNVYTNNRICFVNDAYIENTANNYLSFVENNDELKFHFTGTDLTILWGDGVLNLSNMEDGIDAIVEIEGKDAGEKGILRVLSDGKDKYIELYHDDTDAQIVSSSGDLIITPAGDDLLVDAGLTVGSTTEAGDNNLRVEGTSTLVGVIENASNIKSNPKHLIFNVFNPSGVQSDDTQVCIWPETDANLTITKITVTLDAAGNEVAGDLKYADTFIGLANAVVINVFDTSSGVLEDATITSGSVAAGKAIYIQFDSAPNAAITQMCIDVAYDYD